MATYGFKKISKFQKRSRKKKSRIKKSICWDKQTIEGIQLSAEKSAIDTMTVLTAKGMDFDFHELCGNIAYTRKERRRAILKEQYELGISAKEFEISLCLSLWEYFYIKAFEPYLVPLKVGYAIEKTNEGIGT